jgi:sterol desaturase/sphingolipid hydroxylase (fatty acid hydroxylase superfamily)
LLDIQMNNWVSWLCLMLYTEFTLYWFHRLSHEIRWMWASHAVHHSAQEITFLTAVRLPVTGLIQGSWVNMVLGVWIGFPLWAVSVSMGLMLVYVFLMHTTLVPRLGPLEWIFNTPAHHRVHHSSEREHLDRNYGNMLIIFDRLFGTCIDAKREPMEYGIRGVEPSANFLKAVYDATFGEWQRLIRDMRASGSVAGAIRVAVSSPSAKMLQAEKEEARIRALSGASAAA